MPINQYYAEYFSVAVLFGFTFSTGVALVGFALKKAFQTFNIMSK